MKKLLLLVALLTTASCQSEVGEPPTDIVTDSEEVTAARTICTQATSDGQEGPEGAFEVVVVLVTGAQRDGAPREEVIDVLVEDCSASCSAEDDITACENRCSACVTAIVDAIY